MFYGIPDHTTNTLELVRDWKIRSLLPLNKVRDTLDLNEVYFRLNFNGVFAVPVDKLNLTKIPNGITISNGKENFSSLDDAVTSIYKSRTYKTTEENAKEGILKRLLKALTTRTDLYGMSWTFEFAFIDASNYEVLL